MIALRIRCSFFFHPDRMWEAYHKKNITYVHLNVSVCINVNCHLAKIVCLWRIGCRWISQSVYNKLYKFIKNKHTPHVHMYMWITHHTALLVHSLHTWYFIIILALALSNGNNQFDHLIFPVIVFPFAVFDFVTTHHTNILYISMHTMK